MATIMHGATDETVERLKSALDDYERQFERSEASLYRQNAGSIRVRILDDRFAGVSRSRRHDEAWKFLADRAGDDAISEVSLLLLPARAELRGSLANLEFEDPLPSTL